MSSGLYIATMDTPHFTFTAAGSTEKSAMMALVDGYDRHLKQNGVKPISVEDYAASYSADVVFMKPGICYKDGEPI